MNAGSALLVKIRITCAEPEAILSRISNHGVALLYVHKEDNITATISIKPNDYKALLALLNKWQIEYSVYDDSTFNRIMQAFKTRFILKIAVLLLLVISLYLPGRILFVFVSGNNSVSAREIIESAAAEGICFGAKTEEIRSEKVKNRLLEKIPDLQWVGVNTTGCIATIQVEEKYANNDTKEAESRVVNIVASKSGIVKSCTATKGTLLCKVGQPVAEGDMLISGYTDCGIVIKATQAQGEVYALTTHTIEAVTPNIASQRKDIVSTEVKYCLRLGKKLINFNNSSGIYHGSCAKIYEEQYLVLPGGYILPVSIEKETIITYQTKTTNGSLWDSENHLKNHIDQYIINQMVAGSIDKRYISINKTDLLTTVNSRYICTEMIGREKAEQILQGEFCSD